MSALTEETAKTLSIQLGQFLAAVRLDRKATFGLHDLQKRLGGMSARRIRELARQVGHVGLSGQPFCVTRNQYARMLELINGLPSTRNHTDGIGQ